MTPPAELAKHLGGLKADPPDEAIVKMKTLKAYLAQICLLIPSAGRGVGIRRTLNGDQWAVNSSATKGLEVNADGTILAASIGGAMPTIGGTAIDAGYTPLTIGSGTKYVVATISCTFTTVTLAGRVFVSPVPTGLSVSIAVTGTAPTSADLISTTGTFKLLLASFKDGVKTAQNGHGPLVLYLQDDLMGTGSAMLIVQYPSS
jgi:hypothetical protein